MKLIMVLAEIVCGLRVSLTRLLLKRLARLADRACQVAASHCLLFGVELCAVYQTTDPLGVAVAKEVGDPNIVLERMLRPEIVLCNAGIT